MIDAIKRVLRDEPALITAVVVAVLDLVAALGFDVPPETIGLATAVLALIQGYVTRLQAVPDNEERLSRALSNHWQKRLAA